jgi:hypothetical protein
VIKDKVIIGSVAGMIGTLFKDSLNLILYRLNVVPILYAQLAASAHLEPDRLYRPLGYIIGVVADIATGGAIGVVTMLFLDRFGMDYWWYKGLIIGATVWLFGLGVILNLGTVHWIPCDPVFRFASLFDHLLFGEVTLFFIHRWQTANRTI